MEVNYKEEELLLNKEDFIMGKINFKVKKFGTWGFIVFLFLIVSMGILSVGNQAEAASKQTKAKKAYRNFLERIYEKKDFSNYKNSQYGSISFAVVDISGDKIPELIVKQDYTAPEGYYVYTYADGKVKKLKSINYYKGGEILRIYPEKHIIQAGEGDSWNYDTIYYRVTNKKMKVAAREKNGKYYVNGKEVPANDFYVYTNKFVQSKGYAQGSGKFKFRKNTKKNQNKYLK